MTNPMIQKLRLAIAPCCGLGANPSTVNEALDNVEQAMVRRSAWVLQLMESSSELIEWAKGKGCDDDFLNKVLTPKFIKTVRNIRQQLELEGIDDELQQPLPCISFDDEKQEQELLAELNKLPPASSFIVEPFTRSPSTVFDNAEIHYQHLKRLLWVEKTVINYEFGLGAGFLFAPKKQMVKRQTPWCYDATFKLLDRRINQAIKAHDFSKAKCIEDVRLALIGMKAYETKMTEKGGD